MQVSTCLLSRVKSCVRSYDHQSFQLGEKQCFRHTLLSRVFSGTSSAVSADQSPGLSPCKRHACKP